MTQTVMVPLQSVISSYAELGGVLAHRACFQGTLSKKPFHRYLDGNELAGWFVKPLP
jgi:hypothetical protein